MVIPPQAAHDVHLESGAEVEVVLAHEVGTSDSDLGDLSVRFSSTSSPCTDWKVTERRWTVEPGTFGLSAGASCQALFVTTKLTIARGVNL